MKGVVDNSGMMGGFGDVAGEDGRCGSSAVNSGCACCEPVRRGCCIELHGKPYKEAAVLLTKSELFYDIEFVTNRIARVNVTDEDGNTMKLAGTVTAEGGKNVDMLYRLITSACRKLQSATSWASHGRGRMIVSDMIPQNLCDWTFVFHVPLGWRGDVSVLCSLCHDYVKNKVITDWLKMVAPKLAGDYESQADENLRDVQYELRKEKSEMPTRIYDLTS